MTPVPAEAQDRFRAILGTERVLSRDTERLLYGKDGSIAEGECGLVLLCETTEEVADCMRAAAELELPVVPRGSGTGLAGAAIPLDGAVVLSVARMRRIISVDPEVPCAWVEPGVLNLDISSAVAHLGLHYAPDPSSQAACSIGGNVATNAGGPHCLASGVTNQHILGMELVLPDGEVVTIGGTAPDPPGYDLRGFVVGGEGTLGVVTRVCVRLTRNPPHVRTLLMDFGSVSQAGAAVRDIIALGVIPAAMEMMDRQMVRCVEAFVHAGLPVDSAAVLLVEVDGTEAHVRDQTAQVERICRDCGANDVRVARDEAERALFWKARKNAFGAVARIAPNYYLHDCVVPRTRLVEVLEAIAAIGERHDLIIMNVFHAGDGNLHPLIAFDRRDQVQVDRVFAAGKDIIEACVAVGGTLSGEHGIGLEKRDYMPLQFAPLDLDAQARAREAFDPTGLLNPQKVLPSGAKCGELMLDAGSLPEGTWL
ncbi:MAG: FAD-linked oxidase C-terminal domain-containing protein [Thermoleophilia bacterium]